MVKENKLEGYTQTESLWEVVFKKKEDFILVVKKFSCESFKQTGIKYRLTEETRMEPTLSLIKS